MSNLNDDKKACEYLLFKIREMRKHQKAYFARRMEADKRLSIKAEKEIDDLIARYKARGYNPDQFSNEKPAQGSLL